MTEEQRTEIINLMNPSTLEGNMKVSHLLSEITQELTKKHHYDEISNERERDAKILIQIIHSKIRHLIELSKGINVVDNAKKKIIDPSVQIIISRNIFETIVFFNLLHILHNEEAQKTLIHDLWKLSSLKYRQRFTEFAKSDEAKQLMADEKQTIDKLIDKITSSAIYTTGSKKTIGQIDQAIKKKKFWTLFEGNDVNTSYGPQKLCDLMTNGSQIIKEQYTRYSLYTHPSNETVNIFQNIFSSEEYKYLTGANLKITNCLISMFICDYVKLFPTCKSTFESLPIENQIVCSWYNKMIRDKNSSINKSYESFNE